MNNKLLSIKIISYLFKKLLNLNTKCLQKNLRRQRGEEILCLNNFFYNKDKKLTPHHYLAMQKTHMSWSCCFRSGD